MSRSVRRTPIHGHTLCDSERCDKKRWHKIWRSTAKIQLTQAMILSQGEEYIDRHFREVSSPWNMGKDGKSYWSDRDRAAHFKCIYSDPVLQMIHNKLFFCK